VQGRRILRLFSNVNPSGRPRSWRLGEDFRGVADRFARGLSMPWRGTAPMLQVLRITKSRRTPYDALMLGIHDRMKQDAGFQRDSAQEAIDFPPGSTWIAFTDQVSHAGMAEKSASAIAWAKSRNCIKRFQKSDSNSLILPAATPYIWTLPPLYRM
jgi:hypothetical protein